MTTKEKIAECEYKIESYERMLDIMPDNTLLGRLCIEAYLKHEKKKLAVLLQNNEVSE